MLADASLDGCPLCTDAAEEKGDASTLNAVKV